MSNLTFKNFKMFDILSIESNTCIRTPEPTELGESDSMYILADWLYDASFNNMVSHEIYTTLSTSLGTIPIIDKWYRNLFIIN